MATLVKSCIENKSTGLEVNDVGVVHKEDDKQFEIIFIRLNKKLTLKLKDFQVIDPSEYGDGYSEKVCNVCHKIYPTEFFDRNQNGVNNRTVRRPSCRTCRLTIDGQAMSSSERRIWMSDKPQFDVFECPICKKTTIPGLTSKVVLNHDHNTGHISGWICDSCNTGLGRFKDSVGVLNEAIKYLRLHYPKSK